MERYQNVTGDYFWGSSFFAFMHMFLIWLTLLSISFIIRRGEEREGKLFFFAHSKIIISHIWSALPFVGQGNWLVLCVSGFSGGSYLTELTHYFV